MYVGNAVCTDLDLPILPFIPLGIKRGKGIRLCLALGLQIKHFEKVIHEVP